MALDFFFDTPFSLGTQLYPIDTAVGDGVTTTFSLLNKTAALLGSTVQANNIQFFQQTGGFTKNTVNNTYTLSSPPAAGASIVAPAVAGLVAAAFDNNTVTGNGDNVVQVPFYLADPYTIYQYAYYNQPQDPGIMITMFNATSGFGAMTSWCQLACSDASGNALTYAATGAAIYTAPLKANGVLTTATLTGASAVICGTASTFTAGDYIAINPNGGTFEICQVTGINPSFYQLQIGGGGPNFPHNPGEFVYTCGRKFWLKITIPIGLTNNTAANYYNLALRKRGKILARP